MRAMRVRWRAWICVIKHSWGVNFRQRSVRQRIMREWNKSQWALVLLLLFGARVPAYRLWPLWFESQLAKEWSGSLWRARPYSSLGTWRDLWSSVLSLSSMLRRLSSFKQSSQLRYDRLDVFYARVVVVVASNELTYCCSDDCHR